jgi:Domain of unknown function (DUF4169)
MSGIVNLRQARKQKARSAKEREAEQNRLLHGRTKAEKLRDRRAAEKSNSFLDGHRRSSSDEDHRT